MISPAPTLHPGPYSPTEKHSFALGKGNRNFFCPSTSNFQNSHSYKKFTDTQR
jgi:hypothetical protein